MKINPIGMPESLADRKKRKKRKIAKWLKSGDKVSSVERSASGQILPVRQFRKKMFEKYTEGEQQKLE